MDISLFPPLAYKPTEKSLGRFQAIESGQAIIINNLIKASRTAGIKPIGSPKSPDSAVYTPMIVEGKVIGLLEVQSYHNHAYSNEAREILSMVANQIGLAIQNTRLFHQISQRVEQLSALRSIDMAISASTDLRISLNVVLENTLRHLAVDAADILLLNPTTLTLDYLTGSGFLSNAITRSSMRMGEGLAGRAAFERHPLEIPDLSASQDFSRPDLVTQEGFITYFAVPLLAKGQVRGVLEIFLRRQLSPNEDWRAFLDVLAGQAAIAVDNALLFNNLERANTDLTLAYDATIEGWSQALELRDRETQGHTKRVTDLTMRLARAMQVDEAKLQHVRRGTLLHDIGKMGIPDEILRKPGPLDEGEWEIMRQHPKYAYDMLLPISYLRPALDIPYCHHEKWDGSGYPRGLKGEEIPLPARIFAVVDVFDALTSDRPYREAWSRERALEYIREQTGKHFDPKVAETFLNIL
jgi:putative nucleotidyltransferase with HDIG domain